jgi:hypothetical protein
VQGGRLSLRCTTSNAAYFYCTQRGVSHETGPWQGAYVGEFVGEDCVFAGRRLRWNLH